MENQLDQYINIEISEKGDIISVANTLTDNDNEYGSSKWRDKKIRNQLFAKSLLRLKMSKKHRLKLSKETIKRIEDCGGVLGFKVGPDQQRLSQAFLCHNRYCPICSWRSSLRLTSDNYKILDNYIKQDKNNRLIFLTLTITNCSGNNLKRTINSLNEGFRKIRKRKFYKENFTGDIKTLEITINKNDLTFHPHLHVILSCNNNYFSKSNKYYLQARDWADIWAKCIKQSYSIIDVRSIKNDDIWNANLEISKYVSKDSDYLLFRENHKGKVVIDSDKTDYILFYLINETKGLRFISYAGDFKRIKKELQIKDLEDYTDGDLVVTDESAQIDSRLVVIYRWSLGASNYLLHDYYFEK